MELLLEPFLGNILTLRESYFSSYVLRFGYMFIIFKRFFGAIVEAFFFAVCQAILKLFFGAILVKRI